MDRSFVRKIKQNNVKTPLSLWFSLFLQCFDVVTAYKVNTTSSSLIFCVFGTYVGWPSVTQSESEQVGPKI